MRQLELCVQVRDFNHALEIAFCHPRRQHSDLVEHAEDLPADAAPQLQRFRQVGAQRPIRIFALCATALVRPLAASG